MGVAMRFDKSSVSGTWAVSTGGGGVRSVSGRTMSSAHGSSAARIRVSAGDFLVVVLMTTVGAVVLEGPGETQRGRDEKDPEGHDAQNDRLHHDGSLLYALNRG